MFSVLQAFWNRDYRVGELHTGCPSTASGLFGLVVATTQLSRAQLVRCRSWCLPGRKQCMRMRLACILAGSVAGSGGAPLERAAAAHGGRADSAGALAICTSSAHPCCGLHAVSSAWQKYTHAAWLSSMCVTFACMQMQHACKMARDRTHCTCVFKACGRALALPLRLCSLCSGHECLVWLHRREARHWRSSRGRMQPSARPKPPPTWVCLMISPRRVRNSNYRGLCMHHRPRLARPGCSTAERNVLYASIRLTLSAGALSQPCVVGEVGDACACAAAQWCSRRAGCWTRPRGCIG